MQKDWDSARDAFEAVLAVEPDNKAAKNKNITCLHKLKEQKSKEKKTYQKIFNTIWAEEAEKDKENERRKAEKKEKARAKKAVDGKGDGKTEEEEEEEDPAANDAIGHEEAADIPVLSQS